MSSDTGFIVVARQRNIANILAFHEDESAANDEAQECANNGTAPEVFVLAVTGRFTLNTNSALSEGSNAPTPAASNKTRGTK